MVGYGWSKDEPTIVFNFRMVSFATKQHKFIEHVQSLLELSHVLSGYKH